MELLKKTIRLCFGADHLSTSWLPIEATVPGSLPPRRPAGYATCVDHMGHHISVTQKWHSLKRSGTFHETYPIPVTYNENKVSFQKNQSIWVNDLKWFAANTLHTQNPKGRFSVSAFGTVGDPTGSRGSAWRNLAACTKNGCQASEPLPLFWKTTSKCPKMSRMFLLNSSTCCFFCQHPSKIQNPHWWCWIHESCFPFFPWTSARSARWGVFF